ncbi:MAG: ImmA/IrrE family metallo-endopeptidase [Solobacterium sp.]|nr:ImmA/IrrE family metallo-endopeptidase [Solobacterium sp.]
MILSGSSGAGGLRKLPAGCGAALLFLPSLNGSFLQGASFIDGNRIVVGLSARGKDADKIWFSLFHEPGHIVLDHADQPDRTSSKDEKAADQWAGEEMIPRKTLNHSEEEKMILRKAYFGLQKRWEPHRELPKAECSQKE